MATQRTNDMSMTNQISSHNAALAIALSVALLLFVAACGSSSSSSPDDSMDAADEATAEIALEVTPPEKEVEAGSEIGDAGELPDTEGEELQETEILSPDEVSEGEDETAVSDETLETVETIDAEPLEELPPEICPVNGVACDDEDPCSYDDRCMDGACGGTVYSCDDGRSCTEDSCDGKGACAFVRMDGYCLINGLCVEDGKGLPGNWCVKCLVDTDPSKWTVDTFGACEDDDPCTENETCIEGKCVFDVAGCDDDNPCTTDICIAGLGCQSIPAYITCDNGDICDSGDICVDGLCVGGDQKLDCDDGNACTADACDPELGCVNEVFSGPCDDGDVCTLEDACVDGVCTPSAALLSCDDSNNCTDDTCHPIAGCLHKTKENNICCQGGLSFCDDGNFCTTDLCDPESGECDYAFNELACDDGDACTAGDTCGEGVCSPAGPTDCDDGNVCTNDTCDSFGGCFHASMAGSCDDQDLCTTGDRCEGGTCTGDMKFCTDGEVCTTDSCDPLTGDCVFPPNDAPCEDNNICTESDHCDAGACTGDALPCDDGDLCTTDMCNPLSGCYHQPYSGPCDDGIECTTNDTCSGGVCAGNDALCTNCPPTFSDVVSKFTQLHIGTKGIPGQGLDVDDDPSTCSPAPGCSDGIDNAMSKFAGLANGELDKAFDENKLILLFEHSYPGWNLGGTPYQMNLYIAKPGDESCAMQTNNCPYLIDPNSMTEDCYPLVSFDNFTTQGGNFTAGGPGYLFPFDLPLLEGFNLSITLYFARIVGTYTVKNGEIDTLDGIIGGAVNKAEVITIIENIPDETFEDPSFPLSRDQIMSMINILLPTDIDTSGDGVKDGATMGITFTSIRGTITGLEPD